MKSSRPRPRQRAASPARRLVVCILALGLGACVPQGSQPSPSPAASQTAPAQPASPTWQAPRLGATATPQPTAAPVTYGPKPDDFPAGINPLSGLPVRDPDLLKTPALLSSSSHFPATARPQAGLSFAPYVFEFSITGGETRFLTTFYGEFPAP